MLADRMQEHAQQKNPSFLFQHPHPLFFTKEPHPLFFFPRTVSFIVGAEWSESGELQSKVCEETSDAPKSQVYVTCRAARSSQGRILTSCIRSQNTSMSNTTTFMMSSSEDWSGFSMSPQQQIQPSCSQNHLPHPDLSNC